MCSVNENVPAPEKKEPNVCGPLSWEPIEGGIRIVKLLENTEAVTVPREIEGRPVLELADWCFVGKDQLKQLTLPDTLKKIGNWAFANCRRLHELSIPDSVEELGSHMLSDTAVWEVKLPKNLKAIPAGAFSYCKGLDRVEFNDGLQSIGTHAFYSTLVGISAPLVLPDSVKEIAPGAFFDAVSPNQVKTALPMDPIWFSSVPGPFSPAPKDQPSMIHQMPSEALMKVLGDAVSQLSQKTFEIRWMYQMGLLAGWQMHMTIEETYQNVLLELHRSLSKLRREHDIPWNDAEYRYLNQLLLISCGLGYHLDRDDWLTISLLEDSENADPAAQLQRLVLGEYGNRFCGLGEM